MQLTEPKAWSHSSLTSYETCPKRYWHLSVKKDVTEPVGEMQDWGLSVHKAMEKRFKKNTPFPIGMRQFEPIIQPLLTIPGTPIVEQKLAIDVRFQPSGWFGDGVYCRVVVDAAWIRGHRALLMDWKTGRKKDDDDQLALMAGVMMIHAPEIDTVDSSFCWLQEPPAKSIHKVTFTRADMPAIWDRFLRRVNVFQDAHARDEFPAKPCGLCRRYCPIRSCPYNGAS